MIIIVTYGWKGMKGVQVRGLRIAECFPKEEVVILNDGESDWMKEQGYQIVDFPLVSLSSQTYIKNEVLHKYKPKTIVFADLPTNKINQINLLHVANQEQIPVVILENYYSHRQFQEPTFARMLHYCDLMLVNGVSSFELINPKIQIIPPFIFKPTQEKLAYWKDKCGLTDNEKLITFLAYNPLAKQIILQIIQYFKARNLPVKYLISGPENPEIDDQSVVYLPFLPSHDISVIMSLSDIIVGKMGYLQFLEALGLQKIFVSVGHDKGFFDSWLEPNIKEINFHFEEFNEHLSSFIEEIITDNNKKVALEDKLSKLHDGSYFVREKIKQIIENVQYQTKNPQKTLILCYFRNGETDPKHLKEIIEQEPLAFPVIFYSEGLQNDKYGIDYASGQKINFLDTYQPDKQILNSSFALFFYVTPHDFHSLIHIFPWFDQMVNLLTHEFETASKIIVLGKKTQEFLHEFIQLTPKDKLTIYD